MSKLSKIYKKVKKHINRKKVFIGFLSIILFVGLGFGIYKYLTTPRAPNLKQAKGGYLYSAKGLDYIAYIGNKDNNRPEVNFSVGSGSVVFTPASGNENPSKPREDGKKTIVFKDIYEGVDFKYQTIPLGIKEDIIINKPTVIRTFPFFLDFKDVTPQYLTENIKGTTFFDKDGKYLFNFEKPYAVDAKGVKNENVGLTIKKDSVTGKYVAIISLDDTWMNDSSRSYPITIDPTIVHDTATEIFSGQMDRIANTGSFSTKTTPLASGGTITYSNGYAIHKFTSDGNFVPDSPMDVEVLVVAGGGGGGYGRNPANGWTSAGGGGGGGGYVHNNSFNVSSSTSVTVGSGGTGGNASTVHGGDGGNSVFGSLTAYGGGGGGAYTSQVGNNGGCGGGGGANSGSAGGTGSQGSNGAAGEAFTGNYRGGGGGGASTAGVSGTTSGNGGNGITIGSFGIFAGGGGGGTYTSTVGSGGSGGGGAGGLVNGSGVDGTANTGGGGGGAGAGTGTGGVGGSGVVYVRYYVGFEGNAGFSLESQFQELVTDPNTIALWHMNESSGDLIDSSGNSLTAAVTGTTTVAGQSGQGNARSFDYTKTEYASISDRNSLDLTKAYTLEAWIHPQTSDNWRAIINKGTFSSSYSMMLSSASILRCYTNNTNNLDSITIIPNDTWTHVACVWDGYNKYVYINGKLDNTNTWSGTLTNNSDALTIGRDNVNNSYTFSGIIDEVRISNAARSPEEIKYDASRRPYSIYTSDVIDLTEVTSWDSLSWNGLGFATGDGETATASATSDLVAQWNFNETSDTTAISGGSCGASCNGTLTNFASTTSQDSATGSGWTNANRRWGTGALMFDGSDDYVTVPNGSSVNTVELWVNPKTATSLNILQLTSTATLTTSSTKLLTAGAGFSSPTIYLNGSSKNLTLQPGVWQHIVVTTNSGITLNTSYLGRVGSAYFSGVLDSVKLYSRALTAAEVQSNYNTSKIELQTRVGSSTDANDGTWEAWRPTDNESQISSFDSDSNNWRINPTISYPNSCKDILDNGDSTGDGVYTIYVEGDTLSVYCDMTTDGGGWTLVLNNGSGATTPPKPTWSEAINNNNTTGTFGTDLTAFDQFLGAKYWSALGPQMRLTQGANPSSISHKAEYYFHLNPSNYYALYMIPHGVLTTSSGTASPGMYSYSYVNTYKLSTYDADHDTNAGNCSTLYGNTAWWYGSCFSGSFWGGGDGGAYQNAPYWTGATTEYFAWGAIWLRGSTTSETKSNSSVIKAEGTGSLKIQSGIDQANSNTLALWHMDETGGSSAYIKDSSGNSYNGTPNGTTVTNGIAGKGRYFNGSTDYINVGDQNGLEGMTAITVEAWVKLDAIGSAQTVISKYWDGSTRGYYLKVGSDNKARFLLATNSQNDNDLALSSTTLNTKSWYYLVGTWDATTGSTKVYINGLLAGSQAQAGATVGSNGSQIWIGKDYYNNSPADPLNGVIDEVKISNIALSPNEISERYRLGQDSRTSKTISSTNLSTTTKLPFYIASDRLGTFSQVTVGESAYANYESDSYTIGLWHLDDLIGSGYYNVDSSGFGNRGVPTNTYLAQGKIGGARYFDASSYINMGDPTDDRLDMGTSSFSISAWFYVPALPSAWKAIVNKGASGLVGYGMNISDTNNLECAIQGTSGSNQHTQGGAITAGSWHYGTCVYDRSNKINVYLDGILTNQANYASGNDSSVSTSENFMIGAHSTTNSAWNFSGYIDEARIDKTIRTADEIRQAYEVGARTHSVTIDFKAKLDSGNLIANSSDYGFTIDETAYGSSAMANHIFLGDKIIVKENYDGTEYIAQGTVNSLNSTTGAITVTSWDTGSTVPSGGFTVNATVFKWQREYFDLTAPLSTHKDAITRLTYRITDGSAGADIWLDDLRSSTGYLSNPAGSTITSTAGPRYFQYRAILTQNEVTATSSALTSVTLDYAQNTAPDTPTLDSPTNAATDQAFSPILKTTTTDDDSDHLQYKIELCTNSGMTQNCQTFNQTTNQTGWSGQNEDGNTTYTSGTQAVYTIQTALSIGTTYYWRSYAIDPAGTNTWSGTQASPYSFTITYAPTAPTALLTEDLTNPSELTDTTPYFSAIHHDPDGDDANYYQILVNTASDFSGTEMWNSGKTGMTTTADGGKSPNITYAGSSLSWGTIYYWKIKFWDVVGAEGSYSTAAQFTMNYAPEIPTLDLPSNAATDQAFSPILKTTTTDDDSDHLQYKIELCTNSGMTQNCQTFNQTTNQTGWSGQNEDGNTTYTSGTQAVYTIQTALSIGTTYYWRSYAIDPAGTNTWSGTQVSPNSFTTLNAPTPASNCRIQEDFKDSKLTVIWTDNASNEDAYEIQRSVDGADFSVLQTSLNPNTSTYNDASISEGHTYQYRIAPYFTTGPAYSSWCTTAKLNLQLGTFSIKGLNLKGLILR